MSAITKKILALTACACSFFAFAAMPAFAFQIEPMAHDIWLTDEGEYGYEIAIQNDSNETKNYELNIRKVELKDGEVASISTISASESEWFSITPSAQIPAGEGQIQVLQVNIPASAIEGTLVYAVEVKELASNSQLAVNTSILSLIFITASPEQASSTVEITNTRIQKPKKESPYFQAEFTAVNDGSGVIQPQGTVELKNMFGKTLASSQINIANRRVLPGEERVFIVALDGMSRSTLFGRYTVELEVRAWPRAAEVVHEFRVWQFSPNALALVGVMLGILFAILILRRVVR